MDAIGSVQNVVTQRASAPSGQGSTLPLPHPVNAAEVGVPVPEPASFDLAAAEQKRFEAVQRIAQDIANIYIVSDQRFTIFKDSNGQYITRFTSLRDGKVTYIPEPELFKIGGGVGAALLKIEA